jgi:hypothetical protein
VFLERDRPDFFQSFHLVDDQADDGEIKTSGRGVKMKGELSFVFEIKMELEFIQVNLEGRPRTFNHFYPRGTG